MALKQLVEVNLRDNFLRQIPESTERPEVFADIDRWLGMGFCFLGNVWNGSGYVIHLERDDGVCRITLLSQKPYVREIVGAKIAVR